MLSAIWDESIEGVIWLKKKMICVWCASSGKIYFGLDCYKTIYSCCYGPF